MNEDKIVTLINIIKRWKVDIDRFADGFISTKYSRLQAEMKDVIQALTEIKNGE